MDRGCVTRRRVRLAETFLHETSVRLSLRTCERPVKLSRVSAVSGRSLNSLHQVARKASLSHLWVQRPRVSSTWMMMMRAPLRLT